MKLVNVYDVECGTIVNFPNSACEFMVVHDDDCNVYVVRLCFGELIPAEKLTFYGLGEMCRPHAKSIDELYYDQED